MYDLLTIVHNVRLTQPQPQPPIKGLTHWTNVEARSRATSNQARLEVWEFDGQSPFVWEFERCQTYKPARSAKLFQTKKNLF